MFVDLSGTTALVTGASRGIGRASAIRLAECGANVVLTSRKAEDLEVAVADIKASGATGEVRSVAGNAGNVEDIDRVVSFAMESFGAIDILVNNAATNPYLGPLVGIDVPRAEKTVQVNQLGPIIWTQRVWNAHMEQHGGTIVNMASVGGLTVDRGTGYYNTTKAALIHITKHFAEELGPKVRVNAIAPGLVKTDMARALWEKHGDEVASGLALARLGEPEDIANGVVFLASEASAWITGHTLVIDGGAMVSPVAELG